MLMLSEREGWTKKKTRVKGDDEKFYDQREMLQFGC